MIGSVLVANRGEIAVRIVRTCRELGIRSIVAHSSADAGSAAVELADGRVQIGPGAARDSYLSIPAVVEAARTSGAEAVHPGYGFLSENADLAEICEEEGLVFVGPPAAVLARLADKSTARALMAEAGLPLLPGSSAPLRDGAEAAALAADIGYPVIVKAVAGGGGRGMSVVRDPGEFRAAWERTRASATAVFGDGRLYVERYLDSARHVEVQVVADGHGDVVHLGSRDCSLQRRHQKLVEEAPAPELPGAVLAEMGEAAVRGAKAAGYVGAGTFEFLVDGTGFYFMEVNCRLQVEHPVTEMITGLDLVREQLRIASGEPLGYGQADVRLDGVALECRINAEDPDRDWAPTPGLLAECRFPGGPFTRVDTHVEPGYVVPPLYDSLLAKVVVWAPDRDAAIARMRRALGETRIGGPGVRTTTGRLHDLLGHARFLAARHDTRLVESVDQALQAGTAG